MFKPSNCCSHQVTSWRWARTTSRRHSGHAEWEPQTNENFQWKTWRKAEGPLKGLRSFWRVEDVEVKIECRKSGWNWWQHMAALWSSEASVDNVRKIIFISNPKKLNKSEETVKRRRFMVVSCKFSACILCILSKFTLNTMEVSWSFSAPDRRAPSATPNTSSPQRMAPPGLTTSPA